MGDGPNRHWHSSQYDWWVKSDREGLPYGDLNYRELPEDRRRRRVVMWVDGQLERVNKVALKRLEANGDIPAKATKAFWRRKAEEASK